MFTKGCLKGVKMGRYFSRGVFGIGYDYLMSVH